MKRILAVASLFVASSISVLAQCEKCGMLESEEYDYCFVDNQFNNICAQFGIDQSNFLIKSGKKPRPIPIQGDYGLNYLLQISRDKKLKVSAYEVLFIERALKGWEIEQRKFGHSYTNSGLGYRITTEGTGEIPKNGDKVNVHYTGFLEDGTKFDSSYDRNKPFSFSLGSGQVIGGWEEGVALLKKGSKALFRIPPGLGYGARKVGAIPANSILYFEIELLEE